eukprot:UN31181
MDEVQKHNREGDVWVVINGQVFDISKLIDVHPGGKKILLEYAGKDVSEEFSYLNHSAHAADLLKTDGCYIGDLIEQDIEINTKPVDQREILIIGAGIVGASLAYFLGEKGYRVRVLEKAPLSGGTGLKSSAIMFLGPLLERSDTVEKTNMTKWLGNEAYRILDGIQSKHDISFEPRGMLGLCQTEEELAMAAKVFGPEGRIPNGAEILSGNEEVKKYEPNVGPNVIGASYHKRGATCDPYSTVNHFLTGSDNIKVLYNHSIKDIQKIDDEYFVVCDSLEGEVCISSPEIAICTGWLAGEHSKLLGYDVPVYGVHGQMWSIPCPENFTLKHNIYGWESLTHWGKNKIPHNLR